MHIVNLIQLDDSVNIPIKYISQIVSLYENDRIKYKIIKTNL